MPKTDLDQRCINALRVLSMDGVQKAKSGHPGMPMGMADVAYVLWARHLKRPSYSQLMRRLKTPAIQAHVQDLNQDLLRRLPTSTDKAVDGKPMVVSDYSKDPDAKVGEQPAATRPIPPDTRDGAARWHLHRW